MQALSTKGRPVSLPGSKDLRKAANYYEEALEELFDPFHTLGDPELEKAKDQAVKFCRDMGSADKPARWLTLLGPTGTGKTMLARRIARFFSRYLDALPDERNREGEAWSRRGGFKEWGSVCRDMIEGDYTGLRDLRGDWFVGLDDIGAEYRGNRELSIAKLYEVLNARLGLWTVVTANITLDQIGERLDQRISSRLLRGGSAVVNVNTLDFSLR